MRLHLKPIQSKILVKLAAARQIGYADLADAVLPRGDLPLARRNALRTEACMQIDLLLVYGLILVNEGEGGRVCTAPAGVIAWAQENKKLGTSRGYASITLPLMAMAVVAATSGCSYIPFLQPQETPAPVVSRYNAEGTPPPERMEQFYSPKTNSMVYRFCVGDECPAPTPKKPRSTMSVVNEIDTVLPGGPTASVDSTLPTKASRELLVSPKPTPKTATNDKAAANVAAQLEQQRRAFLEASGAPQPAAVATPAKKMSVKTLGENAPAPAPQPQAPQIPTNVKPRNPDLQGLVPTTGTRVPDKPQAKVDGLEGTVLAEFSSPDSAGSPTAAPAASSSASVTDFMDRWARLWSGKQPDAYFNLYTNNFTPTYGANKTFARFEQERRRVMMRPGALKVSVDVVKSDVITVDKLELGATIVCWQDYESKTFKSRVMKSFDLVKIDGDWKILRENLVTPASNPLA